jgi:hypothetical protein
MPSLVPTRPCRRRATPLPCRPLIPCGLAGVGDSRRQQDAFLVDGALDPHIGLVGVARRRLAPGLMAAATPRRQGVSMPFALSG